MSKSDGIQEDNTLTGMAKKWLDALFGEKNNPNGSVEEENKSDLSPAGFIKAFLSPSHPERDEALGLFLITLTGRQEEEGRNEIVTGLIDALTTKDDAMERARAAAALLRIQRNDNRFEEHIIPSFGKYLENRSEEQEIRPVTMLLAGAAGSFSTDNVQDVLIPALNDMAGKGHNDTVTQCIAYSLKACRETLDKRDEERRPDNHQTDAAEGPLASLG